STHQVFRVSQMNQEPVRRGIPCTESSENLRWGIRTRLKKCLPQDDFKQISALERFARQLDFCRVFTGLVVAGMLNARSTRIGPSRPLARNSHGGTAVAKFKFVTMANGTFKPVIHDHQFIR